MQENILVKVDQIIFSLILISFIQVCFSFQITCLIAEQTLILFKYKHHKNHFRNLIAKIVKFKSIFLSNS